MSKSSACYRYCISSNKKYLKSSLLRFVKNKDDEVFIDFNQKIDGRGCYVYPSKENLEIVVKKKLISRSLRCNVNKEIYDRIGEIEVE